MSFNAVFALKVEMFVTIFINVFHLILQKIENGIAWVGKMKTGKNCVLSFVKNYWTANKLDRSNQMKKVFSNEFDFVLEAQTFVKK